MQTIRTSPPPPHAEQLHLWTLENAAGLRELRASIQRELIGHPLVRAADHDDILDRIVLVATELATNAIRHGRPPTEVRLLRTDDSLILDVADRDLTRLPELAHTRPLHAGGRGLLLALTFSLEVGWYATEEKKHIWATFPLRPDDVTR
ncbi:ATP-binding protein [Actinoplanes missouriensis]|uniref:ATP-binding protein n=1 Tax=Actinoplanes missouriensis TaxID=1866 RepID=UPI0033D1EDF4